MQDILQFPQIVAVFDDFSEFCCIFEKSSDTAKFWGEIEEKSSNFLLPTFKNGRFWKQKCSQYIAISLCNFVYMQVGFLKMKMLF